MGMFCPNCKGLMFPAKDGELECRACKLKKESQDKLTVVAEQEDREISIFEEEGGTLPTINIKCPKCEHNVAEWHSRQMRAADEAPTRIYRCVKCKNTWREND